MITTIFGRRPIKKQKRSWENPATPLSDPDTWAIEMFGGGRSSSGISVNAASAMTYPPVWRAVNLISKDVARLPLHIYRRVGEGKERAREHAAYPLLRYKPNEYHTSFQFKMTITAQALLRGNGYGFIFRTGGGFPESIAILDASKTYPKRMDGKLRYITQISLDNGSSQELALEASDVIHIKGMGDGDEGFSVVAQARESLGLGMAAERFGATFFKNGARPSVVIEHPLALGEEGIRNLRRSWQETYSGIDNAHKAAILEEGAKLNTFSMSNQDAQFLETRQYSVKDVANWFGVPPHKLGDETKTSYASLEQENQSYLDESLDPWLVCWEEELRDKVLALPEQRNDTHLVEFQRLALVRADIESRGKFYHDALQDGWMSRDEVRSRENLNPLPDGEGKKYFIPLNMSQTGEDKKQTPTERNDEAIEALLVDVYARAVRRVATQAERKARQPKDFIPWLEESLSSQNRVVLMESFLAPARVAGVCEEDAVDRLLSTMRDEYMACTDCLSRDLPQVVRRLNRKIEQKLPGELARAILEN